MQKIAGVTMLVGSILFMGSVFMPAISGQFAAAGPNEIVALIERERASGGWVLAQSMFAAGPIIAAVGVLLLARVVQGLTDNAVVGWIALGSGALVLAASLSMLYNFYQLMTYPAEVIATTQGVPLLFSVYSALTLAGLVGIGYALVMTGYPKVLGFFVAGTMALALVAFVVTGDTLPLFQYLVMTILGLALLFVRPRAASKRADVIQQAA